MKEPFIEMEEREYIRHCIDISYFPSFLLIIISSHFQRNLIKQISLLPFYR